MLQKRRNMIRIFIILLLAGCIMQASGQGSFIISPGTNVKSSGNVYIVLDSSHLQNNGSLQMAAGDGTIKSTGAGDVNLSGNGTTVIDRLHLAKAASSSLLLQTNIGVATEVNFGGGLLNLGSNVLDLGNTAFLNNERESSRAFTESTGYIQTSAYLNAPASINPGNLGAVISSAQNMGNTIIKRGHQVQILSTGQNSILRYFDITPANNNNLNATLRFPYLNAELNSLTASILTLWKSADNTSWSQVGQSTRDITANYLEQVGINDFSRWTLAPEALATYYRDADGDGYGNEAVTVQAAAPSSGYVANNADCNDANSAMHPGAIEVCNGIDDNCNGTIDENCSGKPTISINSVTVYEAQGQATLTLTLSQKSAVAISVNYNTKDGSAISKAKGKVAKDYTAKTGTVTIPAGALSATIVISVDPDNVQEGTEQFYVDLSKPVNVTITQSRGTVTLLNGTTPAVTSTSSVQLNTVVQQKEQLLGNGLSVRVFPNPSTTYFTLLTSSSKDQVLNVRITDAAGRTIEARSNVAANGTLYIGHHFRPGIYFAEVMQGKHRTQIKLMKAVY